MTRILVLHRLLPAAKRVAAATSWKSMASRWAGLSFGTHTVLTHASGLRTWCAGRWGRNTWPTWIGNTAWCSMAEPRTFATRWLVHCECGYRVMVAGRADAVDPVMPPLPGLRLRPHRAPTAPRRDTVCPGGARQVAGWRCEGEKRAPSVALTACPRAAAPGIASTARPPCAAAPCARASTTASTWWPPWCSPKRPPPGLPWPRCTTTSSRPAPAVTGRGGKAREQPG